MSVTLAQSFSAVGPGITSSFAAQGGTGPYTYSLRPGGAGGSINASSGLYTAPAAVPTDPAKQYDTVVATDSLGAKATAKILVGDALLLFCDVLQKGLGLADGRVYLWDQKIMQPTDAGLYVAVSVLSCRPFANDRGYTGTGSGSSGTLTANQSVNMAATLQVDIISRDSSARMRKEAVLLALNSDYSEQQQNANGFYIGKLPPGAQFTNLSQVDGAAIPYRFSISMQIQYVYTQNVNVDFMNPAASPTVNYVQS